MSGKRQALEQASMRTLTTTLPAPVPAATQRGVLLTQRKHKCYIRWIPLNIKSVFTLPPSMITTLPLHSFFHKTNLDEGGTWFEIKSQNIDKNEWMNLYIISYTIKIRTNNFEDNSLGLWPSFYSCQHTSGFYSQQRCLSRSLGV